MFKVLVTELEKGHHTIGDKAKRIQIVRALCVSPNNAKDGASSSQTPPGAPPGHSINKVVGILVPPERVHNLLLGLREHERKGNPLFSLLPDMLVLA